MDKTLKYILIFTLGLTIGFVLNFFINQDVNEGESQPDAKQDEASPQNDEVANVDHVIDLHDHIEKFDPMIEEHHNLAGTGPYHPEFESDFDQNVHDIAEEIEQGRMVDEAFPATTNAEVEEIRSVYHRVLDEFEKYAAIGETEELEVLMFADLSSHIDITERHKKTFYNIAEEYILGEIEEDDARETDDGETELQVETDPYRIAYDASKEGVELFYSEISDSVTFDHPALPEIDIEQEPNGDFIVDSYVVITYHEDGRTSEVAYEMTISEEYEYIDIYAPKANGYFPLSGQYVP
ncbi:uncharacterized protein YheU (UPF0270 family) [Geomicrobium halophilum]|uniref:Uncharacterized protein YheU (UPF0270 family) n=1 Tax=Geomicrobium halophilum TaxID=549000 RepID=A0A841PZ87_9BACL|nr:hypothetical protein [Geomicrobium halophilum]MBB6449902.1 uncharacterized protein YheU (UPF0270 family) [Geomicrobium halophilum]